MSTKNPRILRKHSPGGRAQRGQALTEMAIVAVVVVPLLLLVSTMAKYFHIKQTAQQAVRSAAWEATVVQDYEWDRLDHAAQRQLQLDRHFGLATDPIRTQVSGAAETEDVRSPMMNSFSDRALLKREDVVLEPYRTESPGRVEEITNGLFGLLPGGDFPPSENGLVTSEMVVSPRNLETRDGRPASFLDPFDNLDLDMRMQHTLLADAWNAAGGGAKGHMSHSRRRSVHQQVESLVMSSSLSEIGELLDDLSFLEILPVLGVVTRADPGLIQPDIVPKDKLEPYGTAR